MIERPSKFYKSLQLPLLFIGLLWMVHLVQFVFNLDFGYLGIYPRDIVGLRGIITAPFIHSDIAHLLSNSIPLLVLWAVIRYFYPSIALRSFLMVFLLTGLSVWLMGRSVFHIGASGVVYGLVTFLLGNGIFRRNMKSIMLALIVLFFYSGMFVGVLPDQEGISWESHLLGAFVGLFTAYYYKEEIEEDEQVQVPSWELEEEAARPYFLPRDVFEKTTEERQREADEPPSDWTSTST